MASIYREGSAVEKDYKKSLFWYEKLAAKGYSAAMLDMGYLYEEGGYGIGKDDKMARYWFKKAAEMGNEMGVQIVRNMKSGVP